MAVTLTASNSIFYIEMEVCYLEDSNFHSKSQTLKELLEVPVAASMN